MYKFETCSHLKFIFGVLNSSNAHPVHSRFESFFKSEERRKIKIETPPTDPISSTKAPLTATVIQNTKCKGSVSPTNARHLKFHFKKERVFNGNDTRTTVMLKNISKSLTKERIRNILTSYCECNYIYIPTNSKNRVLGFAFVNVINTQELIKLYETLQRKEESFSISSKKAADICYSKMQGINELTKAFGKNI